MVEKGWLGLSGKIEREDDRNRILAREERRVCLVCDWWRLQREGKQQEHPGPSIAAQLLPARFPGAVSAFCSLLSTALSVKWIFKIRML